MLSNKFQTKKSSLILAGALAMITGMPAAHATVTTYNVREVFNQVVYGASAQDTYFNGSFSFDDVAQTVSNFQGTLSQAMSGATEAAQTKRLLTYQLSSIYDATLGGLLVTSFFQNSTNVFSGGGFASGGTGTFGNQNAYATIFVNTTNPAGTLATPTSPYVNYKLAYADCTTGGLMGSTCMTGWLTSTGGAGGTMKGVDAITQTITAAVPEPESYGMMMAGVGMIGFMARRRRTS